MRMGGGGCRRAEGAWGQFVGHLEHAVRVHWGVVMGLVVFRCLPREGALVYCLLRALAELHANAPCCLLW